MTCVLGLAGPGGISLVASFLYGDNEGLDGDPVFDGTPPSQERT